jgi:hypothetical protein
MVATIVTLKSRKNTLSLDFILLSLDSISVSLDLKNNNSSLINNYKRNNTIFAE